MATDKQSNTNLDLDQTGALTFDELLNTLYALETKAKEQNATDLQKDVHCLRKDLEKNGLA